VKGQEPYDNAPVLVSVDPMHTNAKPEALDERLLAAGQDFAKLFGAPLHVAHFYSTGLALTAGFMVEPIPVPQEVTAQYLADVTDAFDAVVKPLALPAARRHLRPGTPVEGLPRVAGEIGAGVVVMGAISRSAIQRIFLGHTAESVLDVLPCDVLVVKPAGFTSDVPERATMPLPIVPAF
jgi:universal stress protein E